jgi:hypothetical protein
MTGLNLLTDTNKILKPSLEYIVPAQTTCNYVTLLFQNLANSNSQGNDYGKWLNVISFEPAVGPNSEGGQASAPASGSKENHLHFNPYPQTGAPGQANVCEAGNEKYIRGKTVIGNGQIWGTGKKTRGQVNK